MRKLSIIALQVLLFVFTSTAQAWNLGAMNTNALRFEKNGSIRFTMFKSGNSGEEFMCGASQWFHIKACSSSDASCIAAVNRMGSMLLAAKMAGKPVHTQNSNCEVTEVALKP